MALVLLLSFAACGNSEKTSGDNNSNTDASQTDPSNPINSIDDTAFNYTGNYINDHLKGDYSITYKMISSETGEDDTNASVKMMRTNEGYYIKIDEDSEMMYIKNGDKYDMYLGDEENGFELCEGISFNEEDVIAQTQIFLGYMNAYSQWDDSLKKDGSENIAGRSCDRFSYEYGVLGTKAKAEYCIDKETGVCLKYYIEGSSGGEGGSYQFECTEFRTNGITLPKYN